VWRVEEKVGNIKYLLVRRVRGARGDARGYWMNKLKKIEKLIFFVESVYMKDKGTFSVPPHNASLTACAVLQPQSALIQPFRLSAISPRPPDLYPEQQTIIIALYCIQLLF
jgi:hypothetical protein